MTQRFSRRLAAAAAGLTVVCGVGATQAQAGAVTGGVSEVRSVYRSVLTAEYFGPASAVCDRLTASGVRSFTAGGYSDCAAAFRAMQHTLRHRTRGVDDSGFTPSRWRAEVSTVMAHLRVTVHGTRASATGGQSGIPGRTTLVLSSGRWKFSSYPPTIQP